MKRTFLYLALLAMVGFDHNDKQITCQKTLLFSEPQRIASYLFEAYDVNTLIIDGMRNLLPSTPERINISRFILTTGFNTRHKNDFTRLNVMSASTLAAVNDQAWHSLWSTFGLFVLVILVLLAAIRQYELKRIHAKIESERREEIERVRTRFYTNITHQFRNPLTVILGMTKELKNKPVVAANLIERNSKQILLLINQMLDLSKLESGKLKLKLVKGDIVPYLRYLTESFHSYAASKNIQLSFYSEVDELDMDFDEEKLQHIVTNLLSNAVKFTSDKGKIVFHVNSRVRDQSEELILKARDDGIGIHPSELPHIFDRFFQVYNSSDRKSIGTGIGLALTKELVHLMKGTITVKSEPGRGSEFTVVLPVTRDVAPRPGGLSISEKGLLQGDEPDTSKKRQNKTKENRVSAKDKNLPLLLIIEDYPDVATYLQTCLEGQYRFEKAITGQSGIDKAIELVPDIIISDVMMPVKDGFEVCRTLKNNECTSHIPIILLTAKSTDEDRIIGLQGGADAYITKPFNKEELSIRLKKLIELRKELQSRYRSNNHFESASSPKHASELEGIFLNKMQAIVEKHLDDPDFSILQFCRDAGLSRTQLHRKLKALTDKSATHFIRSIRLGKARDLLLTTDLNISEIAYKTGFRDPAYFSTSFLEEFGETPSGTRK